MGSRTFSSKFDGFRVDGPGQDTIAIHHRFGLPDLHGRDLGRQVLRKAPWAIYQQPDRWLYLAIASDPDDPTLFIVAEFSPDHTRGTIYSPDDKHFLKGGLQSLTTFVTDQIVLARVLADRQACYLHSAAVVVEGTGLLFLGHSEAGKSTVRAACWTGTASSCATTAISCADGRMASGSTAPGATARSRACRRTRPRCAPS